MLLIVATIAVLGVLVLFIWDTSREQEINSRFFSYFSPFYTESIVTHEYLASPESVWKALTNLDSYQSWFPKITRLLPGGNSDRYVHQFSFNRFPLLPGSKLLLRPNSVSPFYKGRVVVVDQNERISFDLQFNPFLREYVDFSLKAEPYGTSVVCKRSARGVFSVLFLWGMSNSKSKILENLGFYIPIDIKKGTEENTEKDENIIKPQTTGDSNAGFASQADHVAYLVNLALDGDDEPLNAVDNKVIRGKAKAMIVKINRGSIDRPPMPSASKTTPTASPPKENTEGSDVGFASQADHVAYLVNLALDGDDEPLNAVDSKVIRGKAKAMIIKINRGSIDRPPMPAASKTTPTASPPKENTDVEKSNMEGEQELIDRLVLDGVEGKMDEINALENKVLRGKIKAAVVKQKRALK